MTNYVVVTPLGSWHFLFQWDGTTAHIFNNAYPILAGETPHETVQRIVREYGGVLLGACTVREMGLAQGEYHPRMARPWSSGHRPEVPDAANYGTELGSLRGQLVNLMHELQNICQTVHPDPATFNVYGHAIRNLLILACTEVEAHWRAVLVANGVPAARFSTRNYVKLADPLKLREYGVALPYYPWLTPFQPFVGWSSGASTLSIPWYDAYNKVKHDREQHFSEATLKHTIDAVCACAIMLCAQFGPSEAFRWRTEFGYFFQFVWVPAWRPEECYIEQGGTNPWQRKNYRF